MSGCIIPASLERRGCVRAFWIGRIFRVYRLWAAVVTVLIAVNLLGIAERRDFGQLNAATVALALFTVRLHQRSAAVAGTLAVLAAVSVTTAVVLPVSALSGTIGTGPLTWRYAAGTAVVVIACAVGSTYRYGDGDHFTRRGWIVAFLLAILTFGTPRGATVTKAPYPASSTATPRIDQVPGHFDGGHGPAATAPRPDGPFPIVAGHCGISGPCPQRSCRRFTVAAARQFPDSSLGVRGYRG